MTRWIGLLAALVLVFAGGSVCAAEQVDLALVIATDTSRSIDEMEARLQREGVAAALRHPDIISAIQSGYNRRIAVAYIDWSSPPFSQIIMNWRVISDQASADAYVHALADIPITLGQRTSISDGIDMAMKLLMDGSIQATRMAIDVSGDGPNNNGRMVTDARDEAVAKGVTINGLPIINDRDAFGFGNLNDLDDYYRGCVIGGPGAFIVVAKDFEDFATAIRRKLIFEIAGHVPQHSPQHKMIVPVAGDQQFGSGFVYQRGCDIGERQWRRGFDYGPLR